jgi:hypothetical protein
VGSRWQAGLVEARRFLNDAAACDERVAGALDVTKRAAASTGRALERAQKKVTQQDAWVETEATLDELVEVARTHHALLADLLDRVQRLEAAMKP